MKKEKVKSTIFRTNILMVLLIVIVIIVVNAVISYIYIEAIESQFLSYMSGLLSEDEIKDILVKWTFGKSVFIGMLLVDIAICAGTSAGISMFFTARLSKHLMKPIGMLEEGSKRIMNNDYSSDIAFQGELEFENLCETFNSMQHHIVEEKDKNRQYEKNRRDMIAGISHDLRTPMTAIKGTVKGLIDGVAQTEEMQQMFLERAYCRTEEMDRLLAQLFLFSKIELEHIPVYTERCNVDAYLQSYVFQYRKKNGEEDVVLEYFSGGMNRESGNLEVMLDPEVMKRVLDNLIDNSRKYSGRKPVHVRIEASASKNKMILRVSDNGVGVSSEQAEHLFEEFYRADISRNQVKGNGLGLYIVKKLTEAMDGTITADGTDGFVVTMRFPLS